MRAPLNLSMPCIRQLNAIVMTVLFLSYCPSAHAGSSPPLIAYIDEHAYALYTVVPGKPLTTRLVYGTGFPRSPKWSPNGQVLAFTASDGPLGTLYTHIVFANRAGKITGSVLTGSHSRLSGLDWSPDGKRIAYMCGDGGNPEDWEVCVVDIATGEHHAVTTEGTNPLSRSGYINRGTISWSSNGSDVAFDGYTVVPCDPDSILERCVKENIYSVNVDTGVTTQITTTGGVHAQYSPDGRHLVYFHRDSTGGLPGIIVTDALGGGADQVVPIEHVVGGFGPNPAWSPDGREIVFDTRTDGANNSNTDLFVVKVKGPFSMTRVTDTPNDSAQPSWTPILTTCTVPKLKGTSLSTAKSLLKRASCALGKVSGAKKGKVTSQSPVANKDLPSGSKVNIKLQ